MLENIYKLSPASDTGNTKCIDGKIKKVPWRGKKVVDENKEKDLNNDRVVGNQNMKAKRLNLEQRISLKKNKSGDIVIPTRKKINVKNRIENIEELIREYSLSTDFWSECRTQIEGETAINSCFAKSEPRIVAEAAVVDSAHKQQRHWLLDDPVYP
ncbi:RNA polymerase sigma factor sigE [Spatholobus suberectus]|nr:RNA polymerase sigma factor sigE [Spatholobus suberectus]